MHHKFNIESFESSYLKQANQNLDIVIDKLYLVHITEELKKEKIQKYSFWHTIQNIFRWISKYNTAASTSEI